MRLLIDTHALIWFAAGDVRLSRRASKAIIAVEHQRFISAASVYELEIKHQRGLLGNIDVAEMLRTFASQGPMQQLPIAWNHAIAAAQLPRHHLDPFDRILIAQAQLEQMSIVTADKAFKQYDVARLW